MRVIHVVDFGALRHEVNGDGRKILAADLLTERHRSGQSQFIGHPKTKTRVPSLNNVHKNGGSHLFNTEISYRGDNLSKAFYPRVGAEQIGCGFEREAKSAVIVATHRGAHLNRNEPTAIIKFCDAFQ
ncbi:MAG: hypothetical protein EpisKO_02600 [Epibacterium sp.]